MPKDCSFDFEFRLLPGDDPETGSPNCAPSPRKSLLPEMQRGAPGARRSRSKNSSAFPGLDTAADAEITRLVARADRRQRHRQGRFGTEGGLFQQAGIPTVVCGPGSIEQAHKPDEFIDLDQIAQCEKFIGRLFERVLA